MNRGPVKDSSTRLRFVLWYDSPSRWFLSVKPSCSTVFMALDSGLLIAPRGFPAVHLLTHLSLPVLRPRSSNNYPGIPSTSKMVDFWVYTTPRSPAVRAAVDRIRATRPLKSISPTDFESLVKGPIAIRLWST